MLNKGYETRLRIQILLLMLASLAAVLLAVFYGGIVLAYQGETAASADGITFLGILAAIGLYYWGAYTARQLHNTYPGYDNSKSACIFYIPIPFILMYAVIMRSKVETLIKAVKDMYKADRQWDSLFANKQALRNTQALGMKAQTELANLSRPRDAAWLLQALQHHDKETKAIAASALGHFMDSRTQLTGELRDHAVTVLTSLVDDPDKDVRESVSKILTVLQPMPKT